MRIRIAVGLLVLLCALPLAARTVHAVFYIQNANWTSNIYVTSEAGGPVPLTDCVMMPGILPANGAMFLPGFVSGLCDRSDIAGVVELEVESDAVFATEAVSTIDGVTNTAEIPELSPPLSVGEVQRFAGVMNVAPRATFLAIVAKGDTRIQVTVLNGAGELAGVETITVGKGFVFVPLSTPVEIGTLAVENIGLGIGAPGLEPGAVYVLAVVGHPEGGASRFVVGR